MNLGYKPILEHPQITSEVGTLGGPHIPSDFLATPVLNYRSRYNIEIYLIE